MNIQDCADLTLVAISKIDDVWAAKVTDGLEIKDYFDGAEELELVQKYEQLYKELYGMNLSPQELVGITVFLADPVMVNFDTEMLKALTE